jgi:peptide/nickel transport system permease protein
MAFFLLTRLLQSLVVCAILSVIVFFGVYMIGDPVLLLVPPDAGQEAVAHMRSEMGLDLPAWQQYARFLAHLAQGSLGTSFVFREDAVHLILEGLPATLELAGCAMLIALGVGIPLGLYAGEYPDTIADRSIAFASVLGFSLPSFWVGILLILLFAVDSNLLPASGRGQTVTVAGVPVSLLTLDGLRHLVLPAINLALFPLGFIIRVTRSGMREAMGLDFVKFARAQGLSRRDVIRKYVFKYISIPIVTVAGIYFSVMIAFAVVTESVFSWPGMGKLLIDSIVMLDRPVIVAYLLVIVLLILVQNLLIDLVYVALDPRIRIS